MTRSYVSFEAVSVRQTSVSKSSFVKFSIGENAYGHFKGMRSLRSVMYFILYAYWCIIKMYSTKSYF